MILECYRIVTLMVILASTQVRTPGLGLGGRFSAAWTTLLVLMWGRLVGGTLPRVREPVVLLDCGPHCRSSWKQRLWDRATTLLFVVRRRVVETERLLEAQMLGWLLLHPRKSCCTIKSRWIRYVLRLMLLIRWLTHLIQ